ncbi:hypothetical protein SAMN05444362_102120 [Dysgonomonas macrotermitis]|uniref:Uncharacterized protein n=1 Tax=Dysgonomonas macrotermitis TaxID=1346286 RepID=A0A1M4W403_9BACT|nr:hypothetical protein SAMN05444362_102120 [Dysgonomonas macrotermitis]
MHFKQIISQNEDRPLEFKEVIQGNADLINTIIIVFANDVGGELYIY